MPNMKYVKETEMAKNICMAAYNKNSWISGAIKFGLTGKIQGEEKGFYFSNCVETQIH